MRKRIHEIHCELTNQCGLKCLHCSSHSQSGYASINLGLLAEFLYQFNPRNVRVTFTGGEPFFVEEDNLVAFIEILKGKMTKIEMGFFSSGNLIGGSFLSLNLAKRIFKAGTNFVYFTFFSHREDIHDSFTGIKGSFSNTIRSFKSVHSAGMKANVNCVLTSKNINEIEASYKFYCGLKATEVRYLKLIKHGRAITNWDEISINKEMANLVSQFSSSKNRKRLSFGGFPNISPCRSNLDGSVCGAGINKLYVDIYGDLFPCGSCKRNLETKLGTIKGPISEIKESSQFKCFDR